MTLAQRLQHLMTERNLDAAELSRRADVHYNTLRSILKGGTETATGRTLDRLARALDVPVGALTGEGEETPLGEDEQDLLRAFRKLPADEKRLWLDKLMRAAVRVESTDPGPTNRAPPAG